jgi:RNA polymerase sigma-70 factor (ECF subfamily)
MTPAPHFSFAGRALAQVQMSHPSSRAPTAEPASAPDALNDLAVRARGDDPVAVRRLVDAVAPLVFRVVCGVFGRQHPDVDDVTQVALVQVLKARKSFRGDSTFSYFVSRIALRTAIKSWRRGHRSRERDRDRHLLEAAAEPAASSPEAVMLARCQQVWWRLLESLPRAQAETLILRVILDYSLEETATATGVPWNTVRSRLRTAILNLRRRFDEDPSLADLLEGT